MNYLEKRTVKQCIATTLLFGLVASATINAPFVMADDDTGFYIGVAVNRLSADFEDENDTEFDDSDNALSGKFGYMFTDWIGVEIGYIDLGDYDADGDGPSNRLRLDATALSASVVGNWAVLDQMDLYGKIGLYDIDVDSRSTIGNININDSDDENELFFTIGVEYDIGQFNLFTEFSIADTDINDLAIDIATAGVKFEFGG